MTLNHRREASRQPSYVIWRTHGAGFFSILTSILARFHIAETRNFVPVVDLERNPSIYQEDQPVLGTRNVWEYYFLQPAGRAVRDLEQDPVEIDGIWPKGYPYDLTKSPIYRMMWEKYVRLNSTTDQFVKSHREILGISENTLAVHYRGQEMRRTTGHRFPPKLSQLNSAIRWNFENHDFDEIFVVTEAQQYLHYLRRTWGNRLNPSPSYRLSYRNSYKVKNPRRRHRYLLGLEALRDAILMSECGGIVCGHSNLSEAALMLGSEKMKSRVVISQGRNSFRPYLAPFLWYAKAVTPPFLGGFPIWRPSE